MNNYLVGVALICMSLLGCKGSEKVPVLQFRADDDLVSIERVLELDVSLSLRPLTPNFEGYYAAKNLHVRLPDAKQLKELKELGDRVEGGVAKVFLFGEEIHEVNLRLVVVGEENKQHELTLVFLKEEDFLKAYKLIVANAEVM